MGVRGLHKLLQSLDLDVHIKEFKGKRIAVDISSWLHAGTHTCIPELLREVRTDGYVYAPGGFNLESS
jgi:exonuclease-1